MATWREIERIRKDPHGFRALASQLARADDLSDWERAFLESVAKVETDEFTTRQSEKLLEIRDSALSVETIGAGFSVATLLKRCFEARLDLSEADEEWIVELRARDQATIKRRAAGRFLRCARTLGFIDSDEVPA